MGMSDDAKTIIKILLGIVILILLLGVILSVANIGTQGVSEQMTSLQGKSSEIGLLEFNQYDQKTVTGNQVLSALSSFEGKPYAIFVGTRALLDESSTSSSWATDAATLGINSYMSVVASEDESTAIGVQASNNPANLVLVNYGALLATSGTGLTLSDNPDPLTFVNGKLVNKYDFKKLTDGRIAYNGDVSKVGKASSIEYIPTGAKFMSYHIEDAAGEIVGIGFYQITSK